MAVMNGLDLRSFSQEIFHVWNSESDEKLMVEEVRGSRRNPVFL